MSWLSRRETTRIEDMAYCMLGIFGIHMPLLYGEGPRAFLRLQEEILKTSDDHSLFCWSWAMGENQGSLLAPRPHSFLEASRYQRHMLAVKPSPYAIANSGLSIRLPLIQCWSSYIAILNVRLGGESNVGIAVQKEPITDVFTRASYPDVPIPLAPGLGYKGFPLTDMFTPGQHADSESTRPPSLTTKMQCKTGALLSFGSLGRQSDRNKFSTIQTFPPNRFSRDNSILVICPMEHRQEPGPNWLRRMTQTSGGFAGATIVEFTMTQEGTEMIVFAVTTTKRDSYLIPRWHYCELGCFLSKSEISSLRMGNPLSQEAFQTFEKILNNPDYATDIHDDGPEGLISVQQAACGFTTTNSSMLMHFNLCKNSNA
ncbi:Vegetative incompatibility HET-E-1 [Fusarium acutatum]|uniref:Vegetative incompatibility HET-E-1 n=1 Tax=Fusarium acutatum TaxID=78861 RepID=A0A8H4JCQ6_9HYPO|nr:Vegetative incompatibility HET-E-1 [Fusarium acutatum]